MSGKGSAQRPTDLKRFADNWDTTFGREEKRPPRDHGCYAKKTFPCVGKLGSGCLNCGWIITLDLLERGDARCT